MKPIHVFSLCSLLLLASFGTATAQSDRGKIIKPGDAILDPNGDGFVSKTTNGFSFDGYYIDEFELNMFGIPKLGGDVTGDNTGKSCGITDLIPDSDGYSVYAVRDASNNLIFRFRVGDSNPSVEAWTILLDTDGLFGPADPNANAENPGFEIDITLIKNPNMGVWVYNIDGADNCPTPIASYSIDTHFQIAIADEVSCGDPDYFYDIYVPFTEIAAAFGIDENTGLRYAAVTNVSATCAMAGKIADISGVNYDDYPNDPGSAFLDLVLNQCPTAVVDLCETCPGFTKELVDAPTIDTPVRAGQMTISGGAQPGVYIIVDVYSRNGGTDESPTWSTTPRETKATYVDMAGAWIVYLDGPVQSYDKIVASAQLDENSVPCGSDGDNTASTSVTVVQPNEPPIANSQTVDVPEDTPTAITLVGSDPDGDPITYTILTQPANGTLTGTPPNLTYTPVANYNGGDSFTFKVDDGIYDSDPVGTVTINVIPVNDPPIANSQSVTVIEDIAKAITLTGSDIDGDVLTYVVQTQPVNGTLSGTAPNLTYTPNANFNGSDSFTFLVNDGTVNSNVATVTITVTPVNDAPVANDQSVTVIEDTPKLITLTGSDVDGNTLTYIIVSQPANGTISGSGANWTYTPAANYNGGDSFTFKVNDGQVDSNIATVTINVTPVNDAPVANNQTVNVTEDVPKAITLTGSDVDGDPLTYTVETQPTNGVLSGTAPNLTYTPNLNFNGSDSFTFTVNDGTVTSNVATVTINVLPVPDAPIADDQVVVVVEDTPTDIVLTGSDPDGDAITFIVVSNPANGTLSGTAPNLTYSPNANYNGADSFTFKVNDGTGDSNIATVTINVTPVNDVPVANSQTVNVTEDIAKAITLTGSDVDGDALTFTVQTQPTHGTLSGTAPNLTYTPDANYNGSDSFTFFVNDGTVNSGIATVNIIVSPAPDAPIANDQNVTVFEDVSKSITLTGSDPDGDAITFTVLTLPSNGTLSGTAPNLTYKPNLNYNGPDSFTFKVNDGSQDSNTATVSITVTPVNDAPVADNQTLLYDYETPRAVTLTGSDIDGDPLTYIVLTQPANGTLTGTAPNLTYTPDNGFTGSDSFTFMVNDGTTDSNVATITLNISGLPNEAPIVADQTVTVIEDTPKGITLIASDADGDVLTYSILTSPTNGTLSGTEPNLTYTPDLNYFGPDVFTYKVNDGTEDSGIATVTIDVQPVNDVPVANDQSVTVVEDTPKAITLTGSDIEGDALSYIVQTQPTHGTLSGTGADLTYTPDANYYGADSFTFLVNDGTDDSNIATVTINVTPVNDVPVANDQTVVTNEDVQVTITLTATDDDGDALTFSVLSSPANGVLSGTAPNLTYTPNLNFNGSDSFTFKVNDGTADSNTATVSITVNPVNDPPVANGQSVTVIEDTPKDITLTGSDIEGSPLTYSIVTQPSHGTLSGTGPTVTYTPAANYNGPDNFTFRVNDGTANSAAATVSITVTPVNDAPVSLDDVTATTDEDVPVSFSLVGNDTDVDGVIDPSTVDLDPSTPAEDKTFTVDGEGTYTVDANGVVTFTPVENYNGTTTAITYTVKDNDGALSNEASIVVIVNPINDAPEPADATVTTDEDMSVQICVDVTDVENDPSVLSDLVVVNGNGTVTPDPSSGEFCFIFTPNPNFNGNEEVIVTVCDAADGTVCNSATITIIVNPINDPPVIVVDGVPITELNLTTPEDTQLDFCFLAEDVDEGDVTTLDSYSNIEGGGSLTPNASGVNEYCFSFMPEVDFNGLSKWTGKICDTGGLCAELTINITVTPVNDKPIADSQTVEVIEDTPKAITLTGSDLENDPLTYVVVALPANGTLSGTGPDRTYTPKENYFGPDSFTFKVNDGQTDSDVATVTINVLPVNDAPTITAISVLAKEDSVLQVCLNVVDADGDNVTFDAPTNLRGGGTMTPDPDLDFCYIFTPDQNYNGESLWAMRVCDNSGACGSADALITIIPVNDVPMAVDDYVDQQGRATVVHDVLANDAPIETPFQEFYDIYEADSTDVITIYKVEPLGITPGTAIIVNNQVEFTPSGPNRIDSVRYWIVDSGGLIDSAVLYINVGPLAFRIYEGLSPNGDDANQYWQIDGIEQDPNNLVRVYDRFNNLVFEKTNYNNEDPDRRWEGQSNHGLFKDDLPEGTYYYTVAIDLANDTKGTRLFSGYVYLKRN